MKRFYFTHLFSFLLFTVGHATMHYTYVNEEIISNRYYDMDINGDNNFVFTYYNQRYSMTAADSFNMEATVTGGQQMAKAYVASAPLGTYTWSQNVFGVNVPSFLDMFLQTKKYAMVKFMVGADAYYGWFLLDNQTDPLRMYVVSYAWSDVPNQPITAGDMPTGIEDATMQAFNIRVQNGTIQIAAPGTYKAAIINLSGQVVQQQNVESGTIDAGMLPRGIYVLTLTDEKGKTLSRKITL